MRLHAWIGLPVVSSPLSLLGNEVNNFFLMATHGTCGMVVRMCVLIGPRCCRSWTVKRTDWFTDTRVLLLLGALTTQFTTSAKVRSWTTAPIAGLPPHGANMVAEMGEKIYVVAESRYGMKISSCWLGYMLVMRMGFGAGVCS